MAEMRRQVERRAVVAKFALVRPTRPKRARIPPYRLFGHIDLTTPNKDMRADQNPYNPGAGVPPPELHSKRSRKKTIAKRL